jgi:hypothetical protein
MKRSLFYQKQDSLEKLYHYDLPKAIKLNLKKEDDHLYEEGNQLLLRYSEKNPGSEIAFWTLIRKMIFGYEPIFDSIYFTFSGELKNGYAGRFLNKKLENGKQLSVGKLLSLTKNLSGNNIGIRMENIHKNYPFMLFPVIP